MNEASEMRETNERVTENESTILNGCTNPLPPSPSKQVTFQVLSDTFIPLGNTSVFDSDNTKTTARKSSIISFSELKVMRYKLATAFGICCIVMLFLLPIIFYYVEDSSKVSDSLSLTTDIGDVNISQSTLCMTFDCSDIMDIIDALRTESLFPFCIDKIKERFTKLQNYSNDMADVEGIMCQEVRQKYCTAEWRVSEMNNREELINCIGYGDTAPLNCSNQFVLANNDSVCLPLCAEFSQFSETFTVFFPTWFAAFSGMNVIGGIISLIVSVYKIKKLFHYPQILIVMNSILISGLSLLILISSVPLKTWTPLCSKEFLLDALNEPNVFCELQGFTYFTVISIYCYFWFLYTLHLFLRVAHPVVMVQLERSKYARTIHIIEVTLVVLLGTVPNIVFSIHSEFHIITFPPIYCGADPEHNFYSTIVPTILVCCATLIMMLFVLYKIHIQKGIFKRSDGSSKLCCIKLSISEVKIFLTFCYLLIVMVLLWTTFSLSNARFSTTVSIIHTYVQCMSGGIREDLDCEPYRSDFEARSFPELLIVYFALFSILSYSNLPFLIQFKTVKLFIVKTARKLSRMSSSNSSYS